jgi:hypothetical protein
MGCLGQFTLPCETTRASNTDCVPISPTLSGGFNFIDPVQNESHFCILKSQMQTQIDLYGTMVDYQVYNYSLSAHDAIYGEQGTAAYADPVPMRMLVKFKNDTVGISMFGIVSEAQIEAVILVDAFEDAMNDETAEPKADDLITLIDVGSTRPHGRGSMTFRITKRMDEGLDSLLGINPLLSHLVWHIIAVRHEYNSQPNNTRENLNDQVYDSLSAGNINFTSEDPSEPNTALTDALRKYSVPADTLAKQEFNRDVYDANSNPYGEY